MMFQFATNVSNHFFCRVIYVVKYLGKNLLPKVCTLILLFDTFI